MNHHSYQGEETIIVKITIVGYNNFICQTLRKLSLARWALKAHGAGNFEDALQVAAAKRAGAKVFLTLDGPLAEKYQKFLPIKLVR